MNTVLLLQIALITLVSMMLQKFSLSLGAPYLLAEASLLSTMGVLITAAAVMPGSIQFQTFMHGITNVFRTFIPAIVPKQPTVVFLVAENAGLITGQSIEITCGRFN